MSEWRKVRPTPNASWFGPDWDTAKAEVLVMRAWTAGTERSRAIRQDRLWQEWPALAYALDRMNRELTFDEAEATGFDGTGRDGDSQFPYRTSDLPRT